MRSCDNAFVGISRLTDDYLNSKGLISNHTKFEGMALFRIPNGNVPYSNHSPFGDYPLHSCQAGPYTTGSYI